MSRGTTIVYLFSSFFCIQLYLEKSSMSITESNPKETDLYETASYKLTLTIWI